jgi:hypothetical protein
MMAAAAIAKGERKDFMIARSLLSKSSAAPS